MDAKINELVTAMITLYHDDPKRIHHFMKVYAFASAIAQSEQVNALLQTRIEAAALRSGNIVLLQGLIKKKKVHRLPVPC